TNELDTLRSKDLKQGGLTDGQQAQLDRNETRITDLMAQMQEMESRLLESLDKVAQDRQRTKEQQQQEERDGRGKKRKHGVESDSDAAAGDTSEEDDYFDRTINKTTTTAAA